MTEASTAKAKDWHSSNISERARYLLDHPDEEIPTDVSFLVGDGEKEPRRIFKCHKLLLAMMSSMFQAMFYGTLPQTDDTILIPDVTPTAFQHMLRFACGENVALDFSCLDDALDTLYCSKKYLIENLELCCRDYLQLHIASEEPGTDVCLVIQKAPQVGEEDLAALALTTMSFSDYAPHVLKEDGFLRLSFDCLKRIVDYPHMKAKEAEIYHGVRRWLAHNVGDMTGKDLRDAFGSLLHSIRFPLFSAAELADGPIADGVLTCEEVVSIVQFLFAKVKPAVPFLTTPRIPLPDFVFCRFRLVTFGAGVELCYRNTVMIHARPDLAPQCCAFLQQLITGKFHIRFASYDNEYPDNPCQLPVTIPEERNTLSHSIKCACWFEWDMEDGTACNVRIGVHSKSRGYRSAVFGFVYRFSEVTHLGIPFDPWEDQRIQSVTSFELAEDEDSQQ